jgi:hypothetical protein
VIVDLINGKWCAIEGDIVIAEFSTNSGAWRWVDRFEQLSRCKDKMPLVRLLLQRGTKFPGYRESGRDRPAQRSHTVREDSVMCAEQTGLPAIFGDDDDVYSDRLLQGGRAKWVDRVWTMDGTPPREEDRFLVTGTGFAVQRFVDGIPEVIMREPGKSLPDPDELNEKIPRDEWPISKFTGQPEPPWKLVGFVYLLRLHDAAVFTHINSTWGTRICVRQVRERIRNMGVLRGAAVLPIVKPTSAPMPSKKFPGRFRPELEIVEWRQIGANQPAQIESAKPTNQIGKPVVEPTLSEELNDEIPI